MDEKTGRIRSRRDPEPIGQVPAARLPQGAYAYRARPSAGQPADDADRRDRRRQRQGDLTRRLDVVQAIRGTIPGLARAYPGVEESLRKLRRLGYKIYLCSNARREYTDLVLGQIGLLPLFDGTPEGRDGWDKPQLLAHILETERPGAAVMVGDRHFDRTAARENGVPFVGCLYGLFPAEVTGADAEVKSAGELPEAIERLTAL